METLATVLGTASLAAGLALAYATRLPRNRKSHIPELPPGWLPVLSPAKLAGQLETQPLIDAIRMKAGLTPINFERDYNQTLQRFMVFVQLLPASEAHHHARPGGLLFHALEAADIALQIRRAQILPPGVAPEDIQRREHRWTFGVFLAALLHDVGKPLTDMRVIIAKQGGEGSWSPLAGDMEACGALRYRVTFDVASHAVVGRSGIRDYAAHQRLGVFLMQLLVPQSTLTWLAEDDELLVQLTAFLSGEDKENALARIAIEADR